MDEIESSPRTKTAARGAAPDGASLAREAGELAGMASRLLARELSGETDTKRAKELSGIFKDMAVLSRELSGGGEQTLTVRFEGEGEALAE